MTFHAVSWEKEDENTQTLKEWFYPEHFESLNDSRKQAVSKVSTTQVLISTKDCKANNSRYGRFKLEALSLIL